MEWFSKESVDFVTFSIILLSVPIYVILRYISVAPFGRYANEGVFRLDIKVPGIIGWVIMESPNIIVPVVFYHHLSSTNLGFEVNRYLLGLYFTHYLYRDLIYPFLSRPKPLASISFISAVLYCSANGYIQVTSLMMLYKYEREWMYQPNFIIGVGMWLFGFLTNIYSDHLLRTLRKPGETGYKVPRGYLFEYVSGANYFGEIVEWAGYALACWNMAAFSFFLFTAANLIPRGISHHKFYLQKMDDYPKDRKAVIPFLI